jgi:hypothetical protein
MQKLKSDPSKTNLTICVGFIVLYFISYNIFFLHGALTIGSLGLISGKINLLIEKFWFLLAKVLGYVVPNLLLGTIFYVILTPISLLYLLFNKEIQIKLKPSKSSQFENVNKVFNSKSFENPW